MKPQGLPPGPYVDRRTGEVNPAAASDYKKYQSKHYRSSKKGMKRGPYKKRGRQRDTNTPQRVGVVQEIEDQKLSLEEASHLIKKNSRTMVKLAQCMELKEDEKLLPPGTNPEAVDILDRKIDYLKRRIERRLIKLARWADDPRNDDKVEDKKRTKEYLKTHGPSNVIQKFY